MTGDASAGTQSFASRPDSAHTAATPSPSLRDRTSTADVTVLLIDDSDSEAREIVAALSACDCPRVTVEHVSDPKEAEHLWYQGKHDLVIVDVWLGRSISAELMALLTSSPTGLPIVMLSSLSSDELRSYFTDSELFIHSKHNISPGAFAETLGAALAATADD